MFEENSVYTFYVVPHCYRTPHSKMSLCNAALTWRWASENVDCYPKIKREYFLYFFFFKNCQRTASVLAQKRESELTIYRQK